MSFYKCGHNRSPVFLTGNIVGYSLYLIWKESTGFEGDRSQCWKCFCKEQNKDKGKGFVNETNGK